MKLSWDEAKRQRTLTRRGLDFADALQVFAQRNHTFRDERMPYGESRYLTAGYLGARFVVVVWTPRDGGRRIISMRYGRGKEEKRYRERMD